MLPPTITTEELIQLTNYTKGPISELEQAGIIKRAAKNVWPIEAVTKLIAHLRERGRRPADDDRSRFEKSRADRERLKLLREAGDLCRMSEFIEAGDNLVFVVQNRLAPLPAQIGGRDVKLRQLVDAKLRDAQNLMSQDMRKIADELDHGTGKASRRGTLDDSPSQSVD